MKTINNYKSLSSRENAEEWLSATDNDAVRFAREVEKDAADI